MATMSYRVESTHPIVGPFISSVNETALYIADRAMAVVLAAKSYTLPFGKEIRVVHVPSGEVVFRKTADFADTPLEG
jgi:hypothetical protein